MMAAFDICARFGTLGECREPKQCTDPYCGFLPDKNCYEKCFKCGTYIAECECDTHLQKIV